jgi:hypothetical protein
MSTRYFIFYLIGLAISYLVVGRLYFIQGYNEANFDKKSANLKLEQCYEVIRQ